MTKTLAWVGNGAWRPVMHKYSILYGEEIVWSTICKQFSPKNGSAYSCMVFLQIIVNVRIRGFLKSLCHKVLTYVEYSAVSGVFQNIDPPLNPASVSSPCSKGGGADTRRAVRGRGVNILKDARHWIGLLISLRSVLSHLPDINILIVIMAIGTARISAFEPTRQSRGTRAESI